MSPFPYLYPIGSRLIGNTVKGDDHCGSFTICSPRVHSLWSRNAWKFADDMFTPVNIIEDTPFSSSRLVHVCKYVFNQFI